MSNASEFLTEDELAAMICAKRASKQIKWLNSHQWKFELNAAGKPVVGRIYARLRLAGIKPNAANATEEPWTLDLSKVS